MKWYKGIGYYDRIEKISLKLSESNFKNWIYYLLLF